MSVASQPAPTAIARPAKGPAAPGNESCAHPFLSSARNIHPIVNPTVLPKEKWGYRAEPPATGYMLPSSAWTSASSNITRPPATHAIIAAGPAICEAYRAPKSHSDPMIDPSKTNISPRRLSPFILHHDLHPTTP